MKLLKSSAFALITALILPNIGLAQDCVSSSGAVLTINEGGREYQAVPITDYIANISGRDMTNSKGVTLGNFAAVI